MPVTSTSPSSATLSTGRSAIRARVAAVAGALIASLAVYLLAVGPFDVDLTAATGGSPPRSINPAEVILSTLVASLAGWGLLAVLERFASRPARIWLVVALAFLALSMAGPLTGGIGTGSIVAFSIMHLAVAAVVIPVFVRTSTRRHAAADH